MSVTQCTCLTDIYSVTPQYGICFVCIIITGYQGNMGIEQWFFFCVSVLPQTVLLLVWCIDLLIWNPSYERELPFHMNVVCIHTLTFEPDTNTYFDNLSMVQQDKTFGFNMKQFRKFK